MSIDEKELRILEYLEGELSPEEEKIFLARVEADPELAALLEEYQQQDRLLHAYFDSQATAAEKVARPDLRALPSAQVERSVGRRRKQVFALAAAAALALAVGLGSYLFSPSDVHSAVEAVVYTQGRTQAFQPERSTPVDATKAVAGAVERLKTPARSQLEVAPAGRWN